MKNSEVKELSTKELLERLDNESGNLLSLRMNHKISDLDNPQQIKESKRFIARLKTELRKRELNETKS
ncbi:MAG: 50S ribosomal protein L29 [Bacteroidetes bacterium]|nr:50S ribosomal protein L29 [Bacteroidales bacterium]RLD53036.1 MAG: 50S ribosomal protein L29 [Bacteroidota bacterium]